MVCLTLPCTGQSTRTNAKKANPAPPIAGAVQPNTIPNNPTQPNPAISIQHRPSFRAPASVLRPSRNYEAQALMQRNLVDFQQNQMLTNALVSSSIQSPLTLNSNPLQSSF